MTPSEIPRAIGRVLQFAAPRARGGLTVLAYHLVGTGAATPVDIGEEPFRAQMQRLAETGRVRALDEALRHVRRQDAEPMLFALTFDDAYANFADVVEPILRDLGLPATLYVPCDFIDGRGAPPIRGTEHLPPCSWSVLSDLVRGGLVSVGAHSVSHPSLTALPPDEAESEIRDSRRILEDRLGVEVVDFCYPRGLWNRGLENTVARYYRTAAVGGGLALRDAGDEFVRLRRFPVRFDTKEDLEPIVSYAVWTEEYVADLARRMRR